jgi:hypothetical protein
VGERITIRDYLSEEEGGPSSVGYVVVTDASIWWRITRPAQDGWWLVRYDLRAGAEEEFWFARGVRPFVVTPGGADVLFWAWDAETGIDCLYWFHVPTQGLSCIAQDVSGEPAWDFDLDDPWVVWNRQNESGLAPDRSYLMNWREGGDPVLLDPEFADDPHISYPWAVWKATGPDGDFAKARNLEEWKETVTTDACFRTPDVDKGLLVYATGEYLLSHLFVLDLNDPASGPRQISWDNGVERPVIHNGLVVWDYYDGTTGRSAIQGRDLEMGLTFDIGVRGGMHQYNVRNNVVAWSDATYYPGVDVFMMLTRPYPLRGDMNGDNCVDVTDIALVSSHLGAVEGDPEYDRGWDLNWDGVVNDVDIMLVDKHWGEGCAAPTPVGGVIVPVNKFELLLPRLCAGLVVLLSGGVWMSRHIL